VERLVASEWPPIVLVSPDIRPALKQIAAAHIPQLIVLSYNEITADTKIESMTRILQAA
jgi:flagellar biosynthesis protein FlhA